MYNSQFTFKFNPSTQKIIDNKIQLFGKYLDRTGMEHKPYQFDGVAWCIHNEITDTPLYGVRGGIIADEMGLGKTIMLIGLMICNFIPRTLIVVPTILIDQWASQIYKTTGHKPLIFHGQNKKNITLDILKNSKIVITTYGTISLFGIKDKNNQKNISTHLLTQVEWSRIIYDEAHHLKNKKTLLYRSVQKLNTKINWLVTGTPIQNSIHDFYSLCSLLKFPECFYKSKNLFDKLISEFFIKRTKKQVGIEMPELHLESSSVNWDNQNEQKLSSVIHEYLHYSGNQKLFLMLLAKKMCIMSKLLSNNINKMREFGIINEINNFDDAFANKSKIDFVVQNIIKNKNNGCGKIVFCHFKDEIDELYKILINEGIEKVAIIDGRITKNKKNIILNSVYDVIILQIQSCCEGLNLQKNYNEIYFVSPNWNPSVEQQAIARCYRIGQTKPVYVYRHVMGGLRIDNIENNIENNIEYESMDLYINNVQNKKIKLVDEVFGSDS